MPEIVKESLIYTTIKLDEQQILVIQEVFYEETILWNSK
jgi:hypothetical protein